MTTEAVLFDLDGTLVDSLPLIFRTYRQCLLIWGYSGMKAMLRK